MTSQEYKILAGLLFFVSLGTPYLFFQIQGHLPTMLQAACSLGVGTGVLFCVASEIKYES